MPRCGALPLLRWSLLLAHLLASSVGADCHDDGACDADGASLVQHLGHRPALLAVRATRRHRPVHGHAGGHGGPPLNKKALLGGLRSSAQEYLEAFRSIERQAQQRPALSQGAGAARAEPACDQGDVAALEPYEQLRIKDFGNTSTWGHLCWDTTQGASDGYAQSLFVLSVKAISNFEFDYCAFVTEKLTRKRPDFVLGYWARSQCDTMLAWNSEDPVSSKALLEQGRRRQRQLGLELSGREERWYAAFEALNDYARPWQNCSAGPGADGEALAAASQPCRLLAFLEAVEGLFRDFPGDANTGAYSVLARVAIAGVCVSSAPGACEYADSARARAEELFAHDPTYSRNPAFLHFSLHSFDFPWREIYERGLPFARAYPRLVNGSVHALHMASHIYLRNGRFADAAAADQASVDAADRNGVSGALAYQGGELGSLGWQAGATSGYAFAFNAGNVYHSLEYLQYEVLQACRPGRAAALAERMDVAAHQVLVAAGGAHEGGFGDAWWSATTYAGWAYRMRARLAQQAVMLHALGRVGAAAEAVPEGSFGGGLPAPLSWQGSTDYSNAFYGPQSEAGLWNARALQRLLGGAAVDGLFAAAAGALGAGAPAPAPAPALAGPGGTWEAACGGSVEGMPGCGDFEVRMALDRIREAQRHYLDSEIWYEANLTEVLHLQVRSAAALAAGRGGEALDLAREASDLQASAVSLLLLSSTSVYFVPGTAFHGVLALRLAQELQGGARADLLEAAERSFSACLAPSGRPNYAVCLLGMARASSMLGKAAEAGRFYEALLDTFGTDGEADKSCSAAWVEAQHVSAQAP